jgi:hypothetical protein
MQEINDLLETTLQIKERFDVLIKKSGEHFNIFNILGLSTREVRLHSNLLAELLHPQGSHGMGTHFLRRFLGHLHNVRRDILPKLNSFKVEGASVEVEYYIGPGNDDFSAGGRIDILIRDQANMVIIIENKIYAGDQFNQLIRYDALKNKAALIYLTPDGHSPSSTSAGTLIQDIDFICLSYKEDILSWLNESLNNIVMPDTVKYTIRQYMWLIEQISKKSNTNLMLSEITSTMGSSDFKIEASFLVADHLQDLKDKRASSILEALREKLKEYGFEYEIRYFFNFPRIELYPKGWLNHLIGFADEKGMLFGIKRVDEKKQPISYKEIQVHMPNGFGNSNWWLSYSYLKGLEFNLNTHHPWLHQNQTIVVNKMAEQIRLLSDVAKKTSHLLW